MSGQQRIIDRDVAFYQTEIEHWRSHLRRCPPDQEEGIWELIDHAKGVVAALKRYRITLDENKKE